jgi:hypothetical protein
MSWPCTWWEPTGRVHVWLTVECLNEHETTVDCGMQSLPKDESILRWDGPWPTQCATCGQPASDRSAHTRAEYRQPATGEVVTKLPIGALFDCGYGRTGPDGRALVCVIPSGHWHIDRRATNCGSPEDNEHYCWCRHGDPTQPETVHVDKSCQTCSAGAGSIQQGDFHGFLHHGSVTT